MFMLSEGRPEVFGIEAGVDSNSILKSSGFLTELVDRTLSRIY